MWVANFASWQFIFLTSVYSFLYIYILSTYLYTFLRTFTLILDYVYKIWFPGEHDLLKVFRKSKRKRKRRREWERGREREREPFRVVARRMVYEGGVQIDSGSGCSIIGQEGLFNKCEISWVVEKYFSLGTTRKRSFWVGVFFQIRFEDDIFPACVNLFKQFLYKKSGMIHCWFLFRMLIIFSRWREKEGQLV